MICIAWEGFPQYGARCIRSLVASTSERVVVLATRPDVPMKGMDELAGCEVIWIERNEPRTLKEIIGEVPRAMSVSGWRNPVHNRFRDEVHRVGGRVIAGCDNNLSWSFKMFLRWVYFQLFIRWHFDGYWVPGRSGYRLMRFLGVPKKKIYIGSYSADAELFVNGPALAMREKRIVYIGRYIALKNVTRFIEAFLSVPKEVREGWVLETYGCGPEGERFPKDPAVCVHPFAQSEELAGVYQRARWFALPSLWDHWGLVVHEAALSGCGLLLSTEVGAREDFLEEGVNGYSFSPTNVQQMREALVQAMKMTDADLERVQSRSLELAAATSTKCFAKSFLDFAGLGE